MVHGGNVVRNLADIVQWNAGRFLGFEEQQIRQGGLGALDLGGQHRFLADVHVKEDRRGG